MVKKNYSDNKIQTHQKACIKYCAFSITHPAYHERAQWAFVRKKKYYISLPLGAVSLANSIMKKQKKPSSKLEVSLLLIIFLRKKRDYISLSLAAMALASCIIKKQKKPSSKLEVSFAFNYLLAEEEGFKPPIPRKEYTGFRVQRIRSLCHSSLTHAKVIKHYQTTKTKTIIFSIFHATVLPYSCE